MQDRRRHARTEISGRVRLCWSAPCRTEVDGELKDVSDGGFRAAHNSWDLEAGQEVQFRHAYGEGRALVMWTRVNAGTVESGFMHLQ